MNFVDSLQHGTGFFKNLYTDRRFFCDFTAILRMSEPRAESAFLIERKGSSGGFRVVFAQKTNSVFSAKWAIFGHF